MKKVLFILFLVVLGTSAFAQERFRHHNDHNDDDKGRGKMAKIMNFEIQKLREELQLDDATTDKIKGIYRQHIIQTQKCNRERNEAMKNLENLVLDGKNNAEMKQYSEQIVYLDKQIFDLKQKLILDVKAILNDQQFAKFIIFRKKFQEIIKDFLKHKEK